MHSTSAATQAIQAILAPAVMVSASALFLLGLNARYVAIITRIRLLNDEKRKLHCDLDAHDELSRAECDRLLSVEYQLDVLQQTAWYLRNSILCQVLAAFLFVLTSCFIGLYFITSVVMAEAVSIYLFMAGILLLLSGITFLGLDIFNSYRVISIEVSEHHEPRLNR